MATSILRQLPDNKGDELVRKTLELVDRVKPLHLSIVGGDPLVRYRELEQLLPQLSARGIYVQVVTSAFPSHGGGVGDHAAAEHLGLGGWPGGGTQ